MAYHYGWLLAPLPSVAADSFPVRTPSSEDLHRAMRCLASTYGQPQVQREFRIHFGPDKRGSSKDDELQQLDALRKFLLPLQAPVLASLGIPETLAGVAALQNVVHRRICEGDLELKRLANGALAAIHLAPLRVYSQDLGSADDVFIDLDASLGSHRHIDVQEVLVKAVLRGRAIQNLKHSELYDMGVDLKRIERIRESLRPKGPISIGVLTVWSYWEKLGLPLQCRSRPLASTNLSIVRLHRPSSAELFRHVLQNQPVVISGCLDDGLFEPLNKFADLGYLRNRCGTRAVRVSGDLCKDRNGHAIFMAEPAVDMPFSDYVNHVEAVEADGQSPVFYMCKMPLKLQLPELCEDVDSSVASPMSQFGDCFGADQNGTHMHFGCGRSSSAIHFDPSENLIAVITGTKTFELYPPYDVDGLYPSKPPNYVNSAVPPFTSVGEMPQSFKSRWPLHANTQPIHVDLVAGDILYLPIFWWHGVTGGSGRNLTLNWWCRMHQKKTAVEPACEIRDILEKLQASQRLAAQQGAGARKMMASAMRRSAKRDAFAWFAAEVSPCPNSWGTRRPTGWKSCARS